MEHPEDRADPAHDPAELPIPVGRIGADRRLVIVAVLVVLVAAWWLLRPAPAPIESTLPMASGSSSPSAQPPDAARVATTAPTSTTAPAVVVQAAGAIARPGVYRLPAGSRVDDLVRRAGGLSPTADRDRLNLASPLADGERVWVPAVGQRDVPEVVTGGSAGGGGSGASGSATTGGSSSVPAGPVNLNTATADQLDALPGVGPATAAAIIAYRDQAGGFRSVDDLLEVRGIGDAKLEQLRPLVVV